MLEVASVLDYAKNLQKMLHDLYKNLPKICIPLTVFNQFQTESQQKIVQLLQSQKNLKIQLKVFEEKNQLLQNQLRQFENQTQRQNQVSETLQKILKIEKQKQKERQQRERQNKTNIVTDRYLAEKIALGSQKKRLSLPYISSNSIHLPVSQKSILKLGRPSGSKPKKHPFVTIPGQGSQILIQHLMNKASINK